VSWWPRFGPQEVGMALLLCASLLVTPYKSKLRRQNGFTFAPIKEVAFLFAGIFAAMIPALYILEHKGAALGITKPWQFFWAAGGLSSFLDNAPTYLTFLSLAKGLNLPNDLGFVLNDGSGLSAAVLAAISCGAVFMGANSYIGNGPNFMVKSIAEEQGVKMPSFFGYMAYSIAILIPTFILITFIFFV
jgi:Na+/H+ antiporter NhaD/arsenite permease-like protein